MKDITKASDTNLTLKERLALKRQPLAGGACLLLDVSSSMSISIEPGERRIDALRKIVAAIPGNPPTYAFADNIRKIQKSEVPNPCGFTYMGVAFTALKLEGHKSVIMVTDGEASDKTAALQAVEGLTVQIMYVGSGPEPEFLKELAKKAGGFCTLENLRKPKELAEKITRLLEPAPTSKGAIEL